MRSSGLAFVILASIFVIITRSPVWVAPMRSAGQSAGASHLLPSTPEAYGKLPLYFIENSGQMDGRVAYYIQGGDKTIYFTAEGLTFNLMRIEDRGLKIEDGSAQSAFRTPQSVERWTLKLDFVGANPGVRPRGLDQTEAVFSYFKGSREQWQTGLVYCGYIGGSSNDGADGIAVDGAGNAYVIGGASSTQATFPVVGGPDLTYNGGPVDAFVAKVNAAGTALVYCGYIGGSGIDLGHGIAVDGAGNAYVTGETTSSQSSFPVTGGPDLTFNGGMVVGDIFVAKVNADGNGLAYCGYIGGSGEERGQRIAVDSGGNAYVTGFTNSTEASFPVAGGPDLTFNGSTGDAFVAKVNAAGTAIVYCGYIGGSGVDDGGDIAVDGAGAAYVVGTTASTEASFPVTGGPDLTYNGEISDAFIAKVNAAGSALVYCGYIGGGRFERGVGIAVDGMGQAYVTGETHSTEASFPVVGGPDLTHNGAGFIDAFVAKVNVAGTGLIYCGYIGGSNGDAGLDVAVDGAGNAYVIGVTFSTEADFPVAGGPTSPTTAAISTPSSPGSATAPPMRRASLPPVTSGRRSPGNPSSRLSARRWLPPPLPPPQSRCPLSLRGRLSGSGTAWEWSAPLRSSSSRPIRLTTNSRRRRRPEQPR